METQPATRCQHVMTSGVQCGSPAIRNLMFCYYHQQGRSQAISYYAEAPFTAIETDLPLFEDAHSIQLAVRQVAHMLLHKIVDAKTAGLLLYSLQIASANLKHMKAEKPRPEQLVVDLDRVANLPFEPEPPPAEPPQLSSAVAQSSTYPKRKRNKPGQYSEEEIQAELEHLLAIGRHLDEPAGSVPEVEEARRAAELSHRKREAEDDLPPGTIRACARKTRDDRRHIN